MARYATSAGVSSVPSTVAGMFTVGKNVNGSIVSTVDSWEYTICNTTTITVFRMSYALAIELFPEITSPYGLYYFIIYYNGTNNSVGVKYKINSYARYPYNGSIYTIGGKTYYVSYCGIDLAANTGTTTSGIFTEASYEHTTNADLVTSIEEVNPPSAGNAITYSFTNSTVSGPSEAVPNTLVTVSAIPDVGYGITDASTQILVTNNDVAVPYTWDAANNRITFTMPEPS